MSPRQDIIKILKARQLARQNIGQRSHIEPSLASNRKVVNSLPLNTSGRDFVVGDIHGAFELIHSALHLVGFNATHDRLLSVGDLIDRGNESNAVTEFLDLPFVHAVRGNHEEAFCQFDPQTIKSLAALDYNGMGWAKSLSESRIAQIQERLATLPSALEVQTPIGLVGIVHADIPGTMSWQELCASIQAGDKSTLAIALAGRNRFKKNDIRGVSGVERVFVGHTVCWDGPKRMGNVFGIDTGAYNARPHNAGGYRTHRGFLTVANICEDQAWMVHSYYPEGAAHSAAITKKVKTDIISIAYDVVVPNRSENHHGVLHVTDGELDTAPI